MSDDLFTTGGELETRGTWTLFAGVVIACFLVVLGLIALTRSGAREIVREEPSPAAAADTGATAGMDTPQFVLDALLVPALEAGDMPMRWRDPLAAMGCIAGSEVNVDREPLRPGSAVPVIPFILDWAARGCFPFGPGGPRLDGRARLTIYHEDWGFSASVEPAGMRVTTADGRTVHVRRGGAWRNLP